MCANRAAIGTSSLGYRHLAYSHCSLSAQAKLSSFQASRARRLDGEHPQVTSVFWSQDLNASRVDSEPPQSARNALPHVALAADTP